MGIINDLFGGYQPSVPTPPAISTVLPASAINEINAGRLPKLNVTTIMLAPGEVCHYVDKACLITKKTLRHYRNRNQGMSFRVMKGVTYRTGGGETHPIEEEVPVFTGGYLYFTNQRVIFVARDKAFEKKLNSLTAVTPYSDALTLQFGSKAFSLLLDTAIEAHKTLMMLKT